MKNFATDITAKNDRPAHEIRIWRASQRGWHYCTPEAHIRLQGGGFVTADLSKNDDGKWDACATINGVLFRATGRRQIDAATALADQIVKARASRTPLLDSIVVELPA